MPEGDEALQAGVYWGQLAKRPDQLARIAASTGQEPIIWEQDGPAPDIEVLLASSIPESVPAATPRLRLVQTASAGIEALHEHPIWPSSVLLATSAGVHGVQIGEHVLMLLLALRRSLPQYLDAQRRHLWRHGGTGDEGVSIAPGELYGLTLGLIGYGHIGRGVAHLARAFGMRVLATSPSVDTVQPLEIPRAAPFIDPPAIPEPSLEPDQRYPLDRLHDLLAASDAVVICAALTPETEGLIDAAALARMKRGACLVNIARGRIVDEAALINALREERLCGAGLDVTAEEPLPVDSPLWEMPDVIITPHISGTSDRYVERSVNIFLANIERLRRGEPPVTGVDRERGY